MNYYAKSNTDTTHAINAYDFVNLLTWIASHIQESGLNEQDAVELKIAAGNIFFKENFDMMLRAPQKSIKYPQYEFSQHQI